MIRQLFLLISTLAPINAFFVPLQEFVRRTGLKKSTNIMWAKVVHVASKISGVHNNTRNSGAGPLLDHEDLFKGRENETRIKVNAFMRMKYIF